MAMSKKKPALPGMDIRPTPAFGSTAPVFIRFALLNFLAWNTTPGLSIQDRALHPLHAPRRTSR